MRAGGSLGRRVRQLAEQPLDCADVRAALEALAASDLVTREPGEMELLTQRRARAADLAFVDALGRVASELDALEAAVAAVDTQCVGLRRRVDQAQVQAGAATLAAAGLRAEQSDVAMRAQVATGFLDRFTMTVAEARALEAGVEDPGYFAALDALADKRAAAAAAAAAASGMAVRACAQELATHEEGAYARLLDWVVREARRELGREREEFSSALRASLARLRSHPSLFAAALREVGQERGACVSRAFLHALVGSGSPQGARPIDALAGDARRYVGDMLAWVHQACASERELLRTLLGGEFSLEEVLPSILAGVARPLQLRVEQTLDDPRAPPQLFRIDSLLAFYARVFESLLGDCELVATVRGLAARARDKLGAALDALVADVADVSPSPALDVPPPVQALLAAGADILRLHEDAMDGESDAASVVSVVTSALARARTDAGSAVSASALAPHEQSMLLLNVDTALHDALAPFSAAEPWLASVVDTGPLVSRLEDQLLLVVRERSHLPTSHAAVDAASLQRFNTALKLELDLSRLVARLQSHSLARVVSERVAARFVAEYRELYAEITAGSTDQRALALLLSPEAIATLL